MTKIDTGGSAYPKHTIGGFMSEGKTWLDDAAMQIAVQESLYSKDEWVVKRAFERAQILLAEKRRIEGGE